MQLGIHIGTFRRASLEAAFDAVAAHGLECVHFNFKAAGLDSMPEVIDEDLCRRIAGLAAARRIAIATVSGTFNMIHPQPERRREGLRRLETVAGAARRLGAPVVTVCTGTRDPDDMWRGHPDNGTPRAWADLCATMVSALEIAERHDVVLGIEPEIANVVDSAAKARRLLDQMRSPRLKIIIDPANLFPAGQLPRMKEILATGFDLLAGDLAVAHAKDLDRDGAAGDLPAGRGALDYDLYLRLLSEAGFDGPLILHSLGEADAPDCVAMLRQKLAALG